jgi:uncharacterized membrane protein YczE
MPRIPEWLTVDLMIVAIGLVFIGLGVSLDLSIECPCTSLANSLVR